jgi:hypothetical protein
MVIVSCGGCNVERSETVILYEVIISTAVVMINDDGGGMMNRWYLFKIRCNWPSAVDAS